MRVHSVSKIINTTGIHFTSHFRVTAGSVSQPVAGEGKPHMFRNRTIKRVVSKWAVNMEVSTAGNNFPHCAALIILLVLSDCNAVLFLAKPA